MRKIITFILCILFLSITSVSAQAKSVGKFTKVEGRVDITSPGDSARLAFPGAVIFEKDIIRAKSRSKAEILFNDGNLLRLAQNTRVEISEYISDGHRKSTVLSLFRGKIQNKVKKLLGRVFGKKRDRFEVHTPTSVCGVRGTDFFTYYQKGISGAVFKEGQGYGYSINRPDEIKEIPTGKAMFVSNPDQPPIIRPATNVELIKHEQETTPSEKTEKEENEGEVDENKDSSPGESSDEGGDGVAVEDDEAVDEGNDEAAVEDEEAVNEGDDEAAVEDEEAVDDDSMVSSDDAEDGSGMEEDNEGVSDNDSNMTESGDVDESGSAEAENETVNNEGTDMGAGDTEIVNNDSGSADPMDTGLSENISEESGTTSIATDSGDSGTIISGPEEQDLSMADIGLTETTMTDPLLETDLIAPETIDGEQGTVSAEPSLLTDPVLSTDITDTVDLPQEVTVPVDTAPLWQFEGNIFAQKPGTFYHGEYIDPTSIVTQQGDMMFFDDHRSEYHYHFFKAENGEYTFGEKETMGDNGSTSYFYLPDGTLMIASGDGDETRQSITFSSWSGSLEGIADPPTSNYVARYSNSFAGNALQKDGFIKGGFNNSELDLWSATAASPAQIILSGEFDRTSTLSLFSTDISHITEDGGTLSGFMNGFLNADKVPATIYAIYIDPSGNAGVLMGYFNGTIDSATGSWEATGEIYPKVFTTNPGTVTQANFYTSLEKGFIGTDHLTGTFGGSASINIKGMAGGTTESIKGQDWGIFEIMHGANNYYSNPSSTWSANMVGLGSFGCFQDNNGNWVNDGGIYSIDIINGTWAENELSGDLSGKFLTMTKAGSIDGITRGTYSSDTWQSMSSGTWKKTKLLKFSSSFNGPLLTLISENAGTYAYQDGSSYFYHYNLDTNQGGSHLYNAPGGQDIENQYHSEPVDGGSTGLISEKRIYNHATNELVSYEIQNPVNVTLETLANSPYTASSLEAGFPASWVEYNLMSFGYFEGILGGLDNPWTATDASPANITILGTFDTPPEVLPSMGQLLFDNIESFNSYANNFTTPDGGAYIGYIGAAVNENSWEGNIYSIYIDPDSNSGILKGNFGGSVSKKHMTMDATGGLFPVQVTSGMAIAPANLMQQTLHEGFSLWGNYDGMYYNYPGYGYFAGYNGSLELGGGMLFYSHIASQQWGVWQGVFAGTYYGTPQGSWSLHLKDDSFDDIGNMFVNMIASYSATGTWSANKIQGDLVGAWVNLEDVIPMTGVKAGDLAGVYDPSDPSEMTWHVSATGVSIETGQFLSMAATTSGRNTLTALNIPCVEIGNATLVQSAGAANNIQNMVMDNVTFFAYSQGGTPRIWATGNISGNYIGTPDIYGGPSVPLRGDGLSADLSVVRWDSGKWGAEVYGYGSLTRTDVAGTVPLQLDGVAAGQYASGNLTGTGAGTAEEQ